MICRRPKGRRDNHTAARISVPAMRGRLQTPCAPHVLSRRTPAPRRARKPPCNARALAKSRAHRMSSPGARPRPAARAKPVAMRTGACKSRAYRMSSPGARPPRRARKPPCNAHRRLQNPARTACPLSPRTPAPRRARKPAMRTGACKTPRAPHVLSRRTPAPRRARKPPCNAHRRLQNPARTACPLPPRTQPSCNARRLHSARSDPFLCRGAIPAST